MLNRTRLARVVVSALVAGGVLSPTLGCVASAGPPSRSPSVRNAYRFFTDPRPVTIQGDAASAMEPFISRDDRYLLFNTSNVSPDIPALQFATRVDAQTFQFEGQVQGANTPGVLSGTPSMDQNGDLYFVSTRSYHHDLSTVYTGHFASGRVTGVHVVPGVSAARRGIVDFDVEVSADGTTLYVSVGDFAGGSAPSSSSLSIFDKSGSGFVPDPRSARILHAVNKAGMLTYAASISSDGRELFFTQANPGGGVGPAIYRAVRTQPDRSFGRVQRVGAITGFAEAPSISADGTTLYYHRMIGNRFQVASVTRP
jgi:hypothetical protein